jgi:hypothetical protein
MDNKCPLVDNLQLAPWPLQYRVVPPPKCYGESDPCKFIMCYEASIASVGGNGTTLTKSFIMSLENLVANWYGRLQPRSITSWGVAKRKFPCQFLRLLKIFCRVNNMKGKHC